MNIGGLCYIKYNNPDPTIHRRAIYGHVVDNEYVILTPQGDMYVERLESCDDVAWAAPSDPDGTVAAWIDMGNLHDFAVWPSAADHARFLTDGAALAEDERRRRGIVVIAPAAPCRGSPCGSWSACLP